MNARYQWRVSGFEPHFTGASMGHEAVFKVLDDIAMADSMSYWIVAALTLLVFMVMRAMLPVKGLAAVFAPAIFWGGLTGIYALNNLGFSVSTEKSANIVVQAGLGMIVALLVMLALTRLVEAATRIRTPLTNDPKRLRA
ncbi:MAG: hypothetical protein JNN24_17855 [Hyphomicrobium zavarzinii]|uniref:hypothetical protein n=1 Tax=Hyphomicrobium zavarzinii TaxID=48292 RepID=UPI001A56F74E|nr:hypothetical protein [Hyphomicrobium zavarzinii]MBL8847631.1 hypothetical protein [Hyphomicrobium zavarzinii]